MLDIKITKTTHPKEKPQDESKLGFGKQFSDHMFLMDYTAGEGWHDARIVPYGPWEMDPATTVFHYAQEIFEGMKATAPRTARSSCSAPTATRTVSTIPRTVSACPPSRRRTSCRLSRRWSMWTATGCLTPTARPCTSARSASLPMWPGRSCRQALPLCHHLCALRCLLRRGPRPRPHLC